jgi:hypothetical protein
MKKNLVLSAAMYLIFCGFALQSTDTPSQGDIILIVTVNVQNAAGVIKPAVDKNFDKMVLTKIVSYNNSNPHLATQCTMELRIPAKYKTAILNAIKSNYPNCVVVDVKTLPVPTPTVIN